MKPLLYLVVFAVVSAHASVSWTSAPPGIVSANQTYSVAAKNVAVAPAVQVCLYRNGALVASQITGGPGNIPVTANASMAGQESTPGQTVVWRADGLTLVNGIWTTDSSISTPTLVNSAPSVSITGPSVLTTSQNGTWNFSVSDPQGNLSKWRFRASTNSTAAWTTSSGGPASGSSTSSFSTAGTYTWILEAQDVLGLSSSTSFAVTVSPVTYTLTATVTPAGTGSVSGAGTYQSGANATVTAVPASGYSFAAWSNAATGNVNPTTIAMTANKTVTATFAAVPSYTLSTAVSPTGAGSVSGGGTYIGGATATITASPANAYYTFSNWSGAASGSANPTTVYLNGNKSVTAVFNVTYFTLSTSVSPVGAGTVDGAGSYVGGTNATVAAHANTGFSFSGWSGALTGSSATGTVAMTSNKSVIANFNDVQAPSVPGGLHASGLSTGGFTLDWSASSDNVGVAAYEVKQDGTSLGEVAVASKTLTGLSPNTTYQMSVRARDAAGNWSSWSSPLAVTTAAPSPPSITTQPQSQAVVAGGSLTFTVGATGTAPLSYQWQGASAGSSAFSNLVDGAGYAGSGAASLTVTAIGGTDGSRFRCVVTNSVGSATSSSATLSIGSAPMIVGQPLPLTLDIGATANFTVAVADNPFGLTYQWRKNGIVLTDNGRIGGSTSSHLTIATINPTDAGNYTVLVSDPAGQVSSQAALLSIPDAASDNNNDGLPDWWEQQYGVTNPNAIAPNGLAYSEDYNLWLDPTLTNSSVAKQWSDRLRGTISSLDLKIMANGPGTVTFTRDDNTSVTYTFTQTQGNWGSPSSPATGPHYDLKDGVEVPATVTGSGGAGFDYIIYARPDPLSRRVTLRDILLNDHAVDAITKSEIEAAGGSLNVMARVAINLPFGSLDTSLLKTRRIIQLGLGSNRAGLPVGSLTFDAGAYVDAQTGLPGNAGGSLLTFFPGPGALHAWIPALHPSHVQVQSFSGYVDILIARSQYVVTYYPNGSYTQNGDLLDFHQATPLARYEFDRGSPPAGDWSTLFMPTAATENIKTSAPTSIALTRTIGTDVKMLELVTAACTAESPQFQPPGNQMSVRNFDQYAVVTSWQWPWRTPGAARGNVTVLSYEAVRPATWTDDANNHTSYGTYSPIELTERQFKEATASSSASDIGYYEVQSFNSGDTGLFDTPLDRFAGLPSTADYHYTGGRLPVYASYVDLNGYDNRSATGGGDYTELFWFADSIRPGNLGSESALAVGLPRLTRRSFLDDDESHVATAIVSNYSYYSDHPIDGRTLRKSESVAQNGVAVGQTDYSYTFDQATQVLQTTTTVHPTATTSLTSMARTYSARLADSDLRDRPVSATRPDGTKTSYAYQRGTLSGSTWTASGSGPHLLIAELTGKTGTGVSTYAGIAIDPLDLDPNKTVVSEKIFDSADRVIREASYVYAGGTSFTQLSAVYSTYDALGNLTKEADTAAGTNRVFYEAGFTGFRKEWDKDEQGVLRSYTYDDYDRVHTMTRAGATDGANVITAATTTYVYDEIGRLKSETVSAPGTTETLVTSYTYDTASRLKTKTTPGGFTTTLTYDSPTQTTTTLPDGGTKIDTLYLDGRSKTTTGTAVSQDSFAYAYNSSGQLETTQTFTATGQATKTTADWIGRQLTTETATDGGGTKIASNTYNSIGQLVAQDVKAGSTKLSPTHRFTYDAYGRLDEEAMDTNDNGTIDAGSDGGVKQYEQSLQLGHGSSDTTHWYRYSGVKIWPYDGGYASTSRYASQSYEQVSGLTPAVAAHTIAVDLDLNTTESTTAVDRTAAKVSVATTASGTNVTFGTTTLDGLPIKSTSPQGQTTLQTYDELSRPEASNDPRIGTTTVAYVANTTLVDTTTSTDNKVTRLTYDPAGRVASTTFPYGTSDARTAYSDYDAAGRLLHQWGDSVNPLRYEYNDLGQRTRLHTYRSGTWTGSSLPSGFSAAGDVTIWTYQAATGLLKSKEDAGHYLTSYTYDAAGRMATRTDARGWTTNYLYYDAAHASFAAGEFNGLLKQVDYTDGFTTDVSYTYDRNGRTKTVVDAAGTRTFGYYDTWSGGTSGSALLQGSGRLQSETLPDYLGRHVLNRTYQYAVSGRANGADAGLTLGSGTLYQLAYAYDAVGRPSQVTYNNLTPFTYTYVPNSNLVDAVAQGTTGYLRDFAYRTDSNRLDNLKHGWGPTTVTETRLTYDGRNLRQTEKTQGAAYLAAIGQSASAGLDIDYTYTDRGEVNSSGKYPIDAAWNVTTTTARTGTARDYHYDPIGNRTSDQNGSYTPNAMNEYDAIPGASLLTYDANGNLLNDGTRAYTYDAENRLLTVEHEQVNRAEFVYDYLGRRISKKVWVWDKDAHAYGPPTETKFLYDGWSLIAELDGNGALVRRFAWGLDASGSWQGAGGVGGLLAIDAGATGDLPTTVPYYPLYDASFNVIGLLDGSGALAAAYEYDPFGNLQTTSSGGYAATNPFRFSTKYTDTETGFVYFGRRFYLPAQGRFLGRDPIEEKGGVNLYAFCGNDAVGRYDVLGMDGSPSPNPEAPSPPPPPPPDEPTVKQPPYVVNGNRDDDASYESQLIVTKYQEQLLLANGFPSLAVSGRLDFSGAYAAAHLDGRLTAASINRAIDQAVIMTRLRQLEASNPALYAKLVALIMGAPNSGGIDPSGKGDIGTYLVRKNAAGDWVIVGKTNGVTTANAYVNGILGTLGRHAELGGKHMPAGVTEFTLFNNPSKGFFADVWETAMDKLGFTSAPAKALAGVLQGVQSSGSNVSWVAHSQGGAIFAEAMSYAGGSLSHNSVTFNAGANNHWVTNSIAASAGVQVNGYYYSSWDAVPNVIGANGNPLSMLGSVLAAPLLFTDNHSPHTAPTSGWRKRF